MSGCVEPTVRAVGCRYTIRADANWACARLLNMILFRYYKLVIPFISNYFLYLKFFSFYINLCNFCFCYWMRLLFSNWMNYINCKKEKICSQIKVTYTGLCFSLTSVFMWQWNRCLCWRNYLFMDILWYFIPQYIITLFPVMSHRVVCLWCFCWHKILLLLCSGFWWLRPCSVIGIIDAIFFWYFPMLCIDIVDGLPVP